MRDLAFIRASAGLGLAPPPRRRALESVVPMINVVFLLLIFFLMTAEIAPPEPLAVTPPAGETDGALPAGLSLHVAADGRLAYGAASGAAVWPLLTDRSREAALPVRADADLPATTLAALLGRLAEVGVTRVDVAVVPR
jgi:biopolymer transport protein ExbD